MIIHEDRGTPAVEAHTLKTIFTTAGINDRLECQGLLSLLRTTEPTSSGERSSASTLQKPPCNLNFRPLIRPNCCNNNEIRANLASSLKKDAFPAILGDPHSCAVVPDKVTRSTKSHAFLAD